MTQTIALGGGAPEINPLYIKLRRRFACQGDRTIGEIKAQEAIRDGYHPYSSAARFSSARADVSETHVTQANSLPGRVQDRQRVAVRSHMSGTALLLTILAAVLVIFLILSGTHITSLNRELNGFQNNALYLGDSLTLTPEDVNENAASPNMEEASDEVDALSNLLRSFCEK